MITTFEEWLNGIIQAGELCSDYENKVNKAVSNKRLMDIVLDANGVSYLCEMSNKGFKLPYEVITGRFNNFINGKYVSSHSRRGGIGYTSEMFCRHNGKITARTTLLVLLGCDCNVVVPNNHIVRIYADENTSLDVKCGLNSKAIVEYWSSDLKVNTDQIEYIRHE